jgi:hypothetical protein
MCFGRSQFDLEHSLHEASRVLLARVHDLVGFADDFAPHMTMTRWQSARTTLKP